MMRPKTALLLALAAGLAVPHAKADDKQQAKSFEKEVTIKAKMDYLLYLPDDYAKSDKTYPLILFLHGAGESGLDLEKVKQHGPPKMIAAGKPFPFIVVSPQSPRGGWDPVVLGRAARRGREGLPRGQDARVPDRPEHGGRRDVDPGGGAARSVRRDRPDLRVLPRPRRPQAGRRGHQGHPHLGLPTGPRTAPSRSPSPRRWSPP